MATVHVWYPLLKAPTGGVPKSGEAAVQKGLSAIENVGHAALGLDDGTYISWWPDHAVSRDSGFRSSGFSTQSFAADIAAEGAKPGLSQPIRGLAEDVIRSWWVRVAERGFAIPYTIENNPKTTHFDLWRTNCSNIVAIALRLGGAERIVPLPRFDMMTPIHIAAWAKAAAAVQALTGRWR